jgi:site-specific DNA-methyltransferase (adenine-specific)
MTQGFTSGMRSSLDDTWSTPRDFFGKLHTEFNFTLDAAALRSSAVVPNYLGPDHESDWRRDALAVEWAEVSEGGAVWLNPPYGREIKKFMKKANEESKKGITVVCLVPSRTDTNWWWDNVIMNEVRFVKGRLKFGGQGPAPFPSAVVVMK